MPYEIKKRGDEWCVVVQGTDKSKGCHKTKDGAIAQLRALYVNDPHARAEKAADEAKKPYGDVRYADPGYQKDKKKRYPIDTADHVRAAWSYINQTANAAKYTAMQRESIKARIRGAAKRLGVELNDKERAAATPVQPAREETAVVPIPLPPVAPLTTIIPGGVVKTTSSGTLYPVQTNPPISMGGRLTSVISHTNGKPEAAAYTGSGSMVALFLPAELAAKLAVEDGEAAEDMHVTLAYLPKAPEGDDHERMLRLIDGLAETSPPLTGNLNGVGIFNIDADKNDGKAHVTYASVDVPALPAFRQRLVEALVAAGFEVANNHGFTPHCSLKYTETPELIAVGSDPVTFPQLSYASGPNRAHFDLSGVEREGAAAKVHCIECGEDYFADSEEEIQAHKAKHDAKERAAVLVTERVAPPAPEYNVLPSVRAFLTEVNEKVLLTAPVTVAPRHFEKALTPNPHFLWVDGAFVGAEKANRNGAFWSTDDLESGKDTVQHGPVNWLHQDRRIIGAIADQKLIRPAAERAAEGGRPYIQTALAIWRWLFPDEATVIEQASDQQRLWLSMECVSRTIACVGENGCGEEFPYMDTIHKPHTVCQHIRERSSTRHFKDPTFLGTAIIVPPVRPGWAEAHATVMREAAALAPDAFEQAGKPDVPASEWEQIMAEVVEFAKTA